jgi:hypothetical protein
MRRMALLAALSLGVAGCGLGVGTDDKAAVLMRIVSIDAQAGGMGNEFGSTLQSDVLWVSPTKGTSAIYPDIGRVTIGVWPKNPDLTQLSAYNNVILERYEVKYMRSDGRNTQGVDVPFTISGPLSATVSPETTGVASFEVVRNAAKLEPPLMNLAYGMGDNIITCYGEITVHGRTVSGQAVSDMARLQITFANYANTD